MSEMELDRPVFEAVIVPHRSLSRGGLRLLLTGIIGICCAIAAGFAWLGAWPVCGFAGLELGLAAWLLRLHATAARSSELVLLTADGLRIIRTDMRGVRRETILPPAWLSVSVHERPGRTPALVLRSGQREEEVGSALGEAEKRDLAAALSAALHGWRHPRFDNPQLRDV
jgi:uncharacterized membrane protein